MLTAGAELATCSGLVGKAEISEPDNPGDVSFMNLLYCLASNDIQIGGVSRFQWPPSGE